MYTVSKGPSKIVAKTRRGLSQNYEKFETIKESGRKSLDLNSPEKNNVPRPVFQTSKRVSTQVKLVEDEVITPQHEEIVNFISDSWNIIMANNPYDTSGSAPAPATAQNGANANANAGAGAGANGCAGPIAGKQLADSNNNINNCAPSTSVAAAASAATAATASAVVVAPHAARNVAQPPSAAIYCVEPPSPLLSDFKPFDLESWWGRRLFNNITKSL